MWDNRYRPLREGETILDGDECLTDSHLGWQPATHDIGGKTPDPNYTAHRMYRRLRDAVCIEALEAERDSAREAVVAKCRQYDTDMQIMQTSLNREINRIKKLEAALLEIVAPSKRKGPPDFQYWLDVANDRREIARAALAPEQDK